MKKMRLFPLFALLLLLAALNACGPSAAPESGIQLDILPSGSTVTLDGQPAGATPLHLPAAAGEKHRLRVEHEGYYPLELELVVPASGALRIAQTLAFRPRLEEINTRAALLAWSPSGTLYYQRDEDDGAYLYRLDGGRLTRLDDATYRLAAAPNSRHLLSLNFNNSSGPRLALWDGPSLLWQRAGAYAFTWLPDGTALLYGSENGQTGFTLQKIAVDGSAETWQPTDPGFWDGDPEILSLSADGEWLSTQTDGLLQVWRRDGASLQEVLRAEQASESRFSPRGEPWLAYLDANDNLLLADPRVPTSSVLVSGAASPLRWTPDGQALLYPTYNAQEGGSSLWRVDIHTGALSLVADAALLPGVPADFGLSPDGKRLAYINNAGRLFLLTLEE